MCAASIPPEQQSFEAMREMFSRVAPRYALVTRLLSFGCDQRWKERAIQSVSFQAGDRMLDLACGTGDFSRLALARAPRVRVTSADITPEMVAACRAARLDSICAAAEDLPFGDASFTHVFVGYGVRNFANKHRGLQEIKRVLKPGGTLIVLDMFLPERRPVRVAFLAYLFFYGGFLGLMFHGRPRTYTYIADSVRTFFTCNGFAAQLALHGFSVAQRRTFAPGVALVVAAREDAQEGAQSLGRN